MRYLILLLLISCAEPMQTQVPVHVSLVVEDEISCEVLNNMKELSEELEEYYIENCMGDE